MRFAMTQKVHVSRHRLEGSLVDTPLPRLLESCRRHLLTGTIRLRGPSGEGVVVLRAGGVDDARLGDLVGDAALARLCALSEGMYELQQRLPDLSGELGSAARLEGEIDNVPLVAIMRHCEKHALSCTIIVASGFDRGEVVYRAGEIVDVTLNGRHDLDAIVEVLALPQARFRVEAPPLDLDIDGWPAVSREPTAPFRIEHVAVPPRQIAAGTGPSPALPGVHERPNARRTHGLWHRLRAGCRRLLRLLFVPSRRRQPAA